MARKSSKANPQTDQTDQTGWRYSDWVHIDKDIAVLFTNGVEMICRWVTEPAGKYKDIPKDDWATIHNGKAMSPWDTGLLGDEDANSVEVEGWMPLAAWKETQQDAAIIKLPAQVAALETKVDALMAALARIENALKGGARAAIDGGDPVNGSPCGEIALPVQPARLSSAEAIKEMLGEGKSKREIARVLHVSRHTVDAIADGLRK